MDWPPLPTVVMGILGPITVRVVDQPKGDDGDDDYCEGTWRGKCRIIEVKKSGHPLNEWLTYYHELMHSWIEDQGVKMPQAKEEEVCEAFARGRVLEMQRQSS